MPTLTNILQMIKQQQQQHHQTGLLVTSPPKLVDLCARYVAANIPFERVHSFGRRDDTANKMFEAAPMQHSVPEDLQLKITAESFPSTIENVRLYSCLANGNIDEYVRGEQLYQTGCVRKCIQIGFHLSAQIQPIAGPAATTSGGATTTTTANTYASHTQSGGGGTASTSRPSRYYQLSSSHQHPTSGGNHQPNYTNNTNQSLFYPVNTPFGNG